MRRVRGGGRAADTPGAVPEGLGEFPGFRAGRTGRRHRQPRWGSGEPSRSLVRVPSTAPPSDATVGRSAQTGLKRHWGGGAGRVPGTGPERGARSRRAVRVRGGAGVRGGASASAGAQAGWKVRGAGVRGRDPGNVPGVLRELGVGPGDPPAVPRTDDAGGGAHARHLPSPGAYGRCRVVLRGVAARSAAVVGPVGGVTARGPWQGDLGCAGWPRTGGGDAGCDARSPRLKRDGRGRRGPVASRSLTPPQSWPGRPSSAREAPEATDLRRATSRTRSPASRARAPAREPTRKALWVPAAVA